VITAGVDLSSQDAGTAVCVVEWREESRAAHRRGSQVRLWVGADDAQVTEVVARSEKVGIDVPLGWPVSFAEAVAGHSCNGSWPPDYRHDDAVNYRLRKTDVWCWKQLHMPPPLSVAADRIAIPAMRAAALLSRLPQRPVRDGSGRVVEVYPAAALRRWGFVSRGYKRDAGSSVRAGLVDKFVAATQSWLHLSEDQDRLCRASDDAFDALVAALVARAAALGLVEPVPEEHRDQAKREGWIAVPLADALGRLSRVPVTTGPAPA
jgi:predicted nuclease with RNAse H fold